MTSHETVLLAEAVDALVQNPVGRYVDCTYGRGGHSQAIASRLGGSGRLMVIDKDPDAIADARARFDHDPRVTICHGSFADIADMAAGSKMIPLDGVLLDLGVSSPQLASKDRGFSFLSDGPLDMRMDPTRGVPASEWLSHADEQEIAAVLKDYGEERFARRIARAIVARRPIRTTGILVDVIAAAVPRAEKHKHPATRSFQAIRIHVNRELEDLRACLHDVVSLLGSGGRLVVISFHSLEDRIVKRFIRDLSQGPAVSSRLPIRDDAIARTLVPIGKATRPTDDEIARNRRARSSVMRVAEKI
ncbi:MAG: 16S rRNA (cytosine(1402)-N(4))-methyltransferase RsmH [Proteobacteria bacterium]|jgi:16S rRNA (cytosine1402-N4)-methyltransferase|nr:16S rRNA (cytosine(1402)-N(4))-methyltransferase RsmH [Pseudomonadota bacterium]MDA1299098.1 16S rRNA (cytosine(1402)-N(4))-methyltransferase RsmH [Pseudomonadota bacterium]